jgi:uncharacterized protein YkwD
MNRSDGRERVIAVVLSAVLHPVSLMMTIRNIVVFVGTVAASGLAGSYAGFLAVRQDSSPTMLPSTTGVLSASNPNRRLPMSGSGGVVQLNPGEGCSVGGEVANEYPAAINQYRSHKSRKLNPVVYDSGVLSEVATARLDEMIARNYRGVINYRGQDIATELRARGLSCSAAAIIVFKGCLGTPADNTRAVDAWQEDPSTGAVLNSPDWDDIGSASRYVVTSQAGGLQGYYLQVVVFRKKDPVLSRR